MFFSHWQSYWQHSDFFFGAACFTDWETSFPLNGRCWWGCVPLKTSNPNEDKNYVYCEQLAETFLFFFYCSIRSVILFEVCCCCFLPFSQTPVSNSNNFPLKQISEKCERGMTGTSPELSLRWLWLWLSPVQLVDDAIHWINIYQVDNAIGSPDIYLLDIIYQVDRALQRLTELEPDFQCTKRAWKM